MIRHYQAHEGIIGYDEGDVLVDDTTGQQSIVVRDGRGLCLSPLSDSDLYAAAAEAIGESHRGLALRVLAVDERTGRRWLSGESPMPPIARQLLRLLVAHPRLWREIADASATTA